MGRKQVSSSTEEFASLQQARACIDSVRQRIGSLGMVELIEALDRVDRAYHEFPELELERPRSSFSQAASNLLDYLISASEPLSALQRGESVQTPLPTEVSRLLRRFRRLRCNDLEPVVSALRQQGRADAVLEIISVALDRVRFSDNESMACFGDLLPDLLADQGPPEIDGSGSAEVVSRARRQLEHRPARRQQSGSREALLALAERLRRTSPPAPAKPHTDRPWPSGRLPFDEFLLQWPCQVELPPELDDAAFIDEACRAILLRAPEVVEREQYLRLLRDRVVSRQAIIEDLLASEELHSLERRLRVIYRGETIPEPGRPEQEPIPAVIWPPLSGR